MRSIIQWVVRNGPAVNTLMVAVILVGVVAMLGLKKELFPEFQLEIVTVTVPYPGASPAEVEEGICQKIEEAIRAVDGIKKITATAREGAGTVVAELFSSVGDPQKALNEIRSEVDQIPSFPLLAEDPDVKLVSIRQPTIRVAVLGGGSMPEGLDDERRRHSAAPRGPPTARPGRARPRRAAGPAVASRSSRCWRSAITRSTSRSPRRSCVATA